MRGLAIFLIAGLCMLAQPARAQLYTEANGVLMTQHGAAGVDAETRFGREAIGRALPGLRVTSSTAMEKGEQRPVFLASDHGEVLLRIYGDRGQVDMVEGLSPRVYGPGRTQIGMLFREVNGQNLAYCAPGADQWSGMVFCGVEPGANLWFVFRPREGAGPADKLPPPEVLAQAQLVLIRWMAEPGVNPEGTE